MAEVETLRVWELRAQLARPEIVDSDRTDVIRVDFRYGVYQRVRLQPDASLETVKELSCQCARLRTEVEKLDRQFQKYRTRLRAIKAAIRARRLPLP